jgi:hypothetical protein
MELKEECIGAIVTCKADNGMTITQTIVDDKRLFKFYKKLGLNVFKAKKSEPKESDN